MLDKVSVTIPTRNRNDELLVTLEKIHSIGIPSSSIHIIDDFSDEPVELIVKKEYSKVNVTRNNSPLGQLRSRNILFKKISAPYILSLDDDSNLMSAEDLLEAIRFMDHNPQCGIFSFRAYEQIENPPGKSSLPATEKQVRTFIACGCLIRNEMLQKIGYYTRDKLGFYFEEVDCSIRAFKKGYSVYAVENLVVHHRVNRKFREMPVKTDLAKGIYGSSWRSKMGFSDGLIVTGIYYPPGLDMVFVLLYIGKRFVQYLLKKGDFLGFFGGMFRFFTFIPYIVREKDSLSYKQFFSWIRLPSM